MGCITLEDAISSAQCDSRVRHDSESHQTGAVFRELFIGIDPTVLGRVPLSNPSDSVACWSFWKQPVS